ncbi:MAG: MBOAT family O-acyltransferase [Candidatus Binatus sp.]|uniref:MBOAT family O-acyltransferase n=1 Tax=Candidatus Binatus sp. TaxID=2811406 RepID=UPI00271B96DE|nr:MBOAT family O-acyltransferase [Candidatus Binatus sp.]MDO8431582.1 MBOAT family O-acyltransferase [Candidatus Binatus sp.]
MIFNTFDYYLFFLFPAALLFKLSPLGLRPWVIVVSASIFYVYFSILGFGGVIGAFCLSIFLWESIFSRLYRPRAAICLVGVVQSVIFLVIFKYWNYLTGLAWGAASANPWHWSSAFLPLGISFFTFEFIHYAVDRYRGQTTAGALKEYLAFILFFPTLVAGPIKRYEDFLPKLRAADASLLDLQTGFTRILVGLVKKFAVADLMTAFTNHLNRTDIALADRRVLPLWLLAYGIKIYFDFAGYSDIAIGSARLFGIVVPENFDWPYMRSNIADFWRNWHISLSTWLFDYVFIPLGGSRVARLRNYSNLIVTMFISGVWHGAGTNFIVWGLWHGMLLTGNRIWRDVRGARQVSTAGRVMGWAITFTTVNLGWAFFCMDLATARFFFRRLLIG